MVRNQNGSVLLISFTLLAIMSLLGISAMNTARLNEKMASNYMDYKLAFQSAESGLRHTEQWLQNHDKQVIDSEGDEQNIWLLSALDPDPRNSQFWWQERNYSWWMSNAVSWPQMDRIKTGPYTVIEYKQNMNVSPVENNDIARLLYFQITSRGTGGSDSSVVLLQSSILIGGDDNNNPRQSWRQLEIE